MKKQNDLVIEKKAMKYVVTCSGGNDSVALIQHMHEKYPGEFCVLYNDTGWARDDWPDRILEIKSRCVYIGVDFHTTESEGMESLVRRKKGWPMPASKMQFCTYELKEKPSLEFYDSIDPECELVIVTGRRREESRNRVDLPLWQYSSAKHGGRDVFNPIVNFSAEERDTYVEKFGMEKLDHSSMECFPCVCANKKDLSQISKDDPVINRIEAIEIDMGFTRYGKPRTMFRPYRVGGGVGIRQAVEWGHGGRGWKSQEVPDNYKFKGDSTGSDGANDIAYNDDLEDRRQCDGGFCGN